MNELILQQPGRFVIRDGPEPRAGDGDALVRVHRVGICGSDVHAFRGTMPFVQCPRILGHELGVEVQTAPPNERGIRAGDRCAVEPYLACGTCHACGLDRPNCCESLRVLGIHMDGGMRPLFSVPVSCLHASRKLSVDQLALIETLGIGAHAVARSGLAEGERALVVGVGAIGLTTLQFAMAQGAAVTALEINDRRRAFVASRFGVEALAEPDGRDYDVVFDATGNVQAMEASFEHVAAGGRLVFVGLINDRISFSDPLLHRKEITILASRNSKHQFPRIIGLVEDGTIDTAPWITHRLAFTQVPERFTDVVQSPELVKAIIEVA